MNIVFLVSGGIEVSAFRLLLLSIILGESGLSCCCCLLSFFYSLECSIDFLASYVYLELDRFLK